MREIKCRGKAKSGVWIFGDLVHYQNGTQIWKEGSLNYSVVSDTIGESQPSWTRISVRFTRVMSF